MHTSSEVDNLVRLAEGVRATGYDFTTITPRSHGVVNSRPGNEKARSLRDVFGWSRPFKKELLAPDLLRLMQDAEVLEPAGDMFRSRIRLSSLGGDLYIHSAFPTLASDAVFFGPDTYKFVDAITSYLSRRSAPIRRAVDICSGAGPGAITIAKTARAADVFMVDINPVALRCATANAALAMCFNARACLSDMLSGVSGVFDLIVAHPPYLIDRSSRAYRHGGGPLGADLSMAIVRSALDRLAPGGTLLLFTGIAMVDGQDSFRSSMVARASAAGMDVSYREVDPDVFGEELEEAPYQTAERIALVVLEVTRPRAAA